MSLGMMFVEAKAQEAHRLVNDVTSAYSDRQPDQFDDENEDDEEI